MPMCRNSRAFFYQERDNVTNDDTLDAAAPLLPSGDNCGCHVEGFASMESSSRVTGKQGPCRTLGRITISSPITKWH